MHENKITLRNKAKKIFLNEQKSWFALYTKSKSEFKASEQLRAIGVDHYLPTITKIKQWSDRKKKVIEPIIRGYIFIYAYEKERLRSLEQDSIARCVLDNGKAARIPGWQIENLKKILDAKSDFLVHEGLVPGKKVLIKEGPLEGVIGVIQKFEDGKKGIAVSIDLLNRSVIAHLPTEESLFEILKEEN